MSHKKEKKPCFFVNKKAFEFSFAWLFAIIVGAFILFLAIFAVIKLVTTERIEESMKTAKQLTVLFEPLETSLEEGKLNQINLNKETIIINECYSNLGVFGKQKIKTASKSSIGKKFQIPEEGISIYNKYIFSEKEMRGKKLYLIVKPFEMPFKVSDTIVAYTERYCFVSPSDVVKEELESIISNNKDTNFVVVNSTNECKDTNKKVCFGDVSGCDISVNLECLSFNCESFSGFVSKKGKTVYYEDNLLYAAIFSSPEIYECNLKRLMLRLKKIAILYKDESLFISAKCVTGLEPELVALANMASHFNSSAELTSISYLTKQIEEHNNALNCKLYI